MGNFSERHHHAINLVLTSETRLFRAPGPATPRRHHQKLLHSTPMTSPYPQPPSDGDGGSMPPETPLPHHSSMTSPAVAGPVPDIDAFASVFARASLEQPSPRDAVVRSPAAENITTNPTHIENILLHQKRRKEYLDLARESTDEETKQFHLETAERHQKLAQRYQASDRFLIPDDPTNTGPISRSRRKNRFEPYSAIKKKPKESGREGRIPSGGLAGISGSGEGASGSAGGLPANSGGVVRYDHQAIFGLANRLDSIALDQQQALAALHRVNTSLATSSQGQAENARQHHTQQLQQAMQSDLQSAQQLAQHLRQVTHGNEDMDQSFAQQLR